MSCQACRKSTSPLPPFFSLHYGGGGVPEGPGAFSVHIKAFLGDLQLLASYLPPDRTIGSICYNP